MGASSNQPGQPVQIRHGLFQGQQPGLSQPDVGGLRGANRKIGGPSPIETGKLSAYQQIEDWCNSLHSLITSQLNEFNKAGS